jgi:GrpB-like predicted nucleotidyltransferase (UPF0157 family)
VPESGEEGSAVRHSSLDDRFDPAVRIVDYDPAWPELAVAEMARIDAALGAQAERTDHVGSTAVPGLAAKPIVDLQVAVAAIEPTEPFVRPLEELGYLFAPEPDSPDFHFFGEPAARPRTFHLHVCAVGSDHERRHLALRDYLRAHPDEATSYGELKRELVADRPGDRLAYIEGKAAYVAALERRALEWVRASRRPA